MTHFLRRHGFDGLRLTQCRVSANGAAIGSNQVVLLSQLLFRNEGTWGVVFGGAYFHDFRTYTMGELSLLNKPLLSAYLVCERQYRGQPNAMKRRVRKGAQFELNYSLWRRRRGHIQNSARERSQKPNRFSLELKTRSLSVQRGTAPGHRRSSSVCWYELGFNPRTWYECANQSVSKLVPPGPRATLRAGPESQPHSASCFYPQKCRSLENPAP